MIWERDFPNLSNCHALYTNHLLVSGQPSVAYLTQIKFLKCCLSGLVLIGSGHLVIRETFYEGADESAFSEDSQICGNADVMQFRFRFFRSLYASFYGKSTVFLAPFGAQVATRVSVILNYQPVPDWRSRIE